ncbi:MAG: MATE family efflux transporter [Clostridia bacterium]|nr:MATE family efflux transporter [Clostridia bacterium]
MVKSEQVRGEIPAGKDIYRRTLQTAWPAAVESILVTLVGAVDTIMVGGIGAGAIAAVGITNQPKLILMALIMSLNVGVTAVVARRRGENNRQGAIDCLKQSLMISVGISLLLSILGFFFAAPLLHVAGAGEDILKDAVTYFRVLMCGIMLTSVSLTINAAQRGCGNTKISMRTNLTANIINILFDYLLIGGHLGFPQMGVAGAALATVLGNLVACVMSVWSVTKQNTFLTVKGWRGWSFDRKTVKSVMNISSGAMVEQVFMRVGFFVYAAIVARLGTIAFSTHQICMNIIHLSFSFGDGLGIAAASLVGQSLGARRSDMAIIYGKTAQRVAFAASTLLFFLFIFGRRFLVMLFTDEAAIIAQGAVILVIIAFTTHAQTSQVVMTGSLRGAGDTKFVALTAFLSIAVIRPTLTWLLCMVGSFGLSGAWIALLIDQYMRMSFNLARFSHGKWTTKEL